MLLVIELELMLFYDRSALLYLYKNAYIMWHANKSITDLNKPDKRTWVNNYSLQTSRQIDRLYLR